MAKLLATIICLFFLTNNVLSKTYYHDYKVYEVVPESLEQARTLQSFSEKLKLDFWQESRGIGLASHVMVAPEDSGYFEHLLSKNGLNYKIVVMNVEEMIQNEKNDNELSNIRSSLTTGSITFSSFLFYEEHMAYVRRIAQDYPDVTALTTIGQSYEGRDILLLKISSGPSESSVPKPVIFIDAGIHCREWIAPPVALYVIHQLVENSSNAAFYQNVDWVIVPNLNPDGYVYTQTTNRLWRKNRRLAEGASCYGTDLNRNFGYMWMFAGASNNSCTDIYAGPEAFSEPETQALRDWILANNENIKIYLTVHSYGEMFIYPWSYAAEYPEDWEDLQYVGELAAKAINETTTIGSRYVVENSAILLGATAGSSDDWAKGSANISLSYTVELPDGDSPYWFMIPARQILPVVQETWTGFQAIHGYIEEKFWFDAIENDV